MAKRLLVSGIISLVLLGCGGSGGSTGTPTGVSRTVIVSGLDAPMQYVPHPVNSHLAYVLERAGTIRLLVDDVLQATPVLDIRSDVSTTGEGGLLGMTFASDFATSRQFFLNFVAESPLRTRIVRYTLSADGLTASSGQSVIDIAQPYTNHKGGTIHFGPDGMLYVGMGDGGSGNDPDHRAQDPTSLLGKFLRIDPSGDDFPSDAVNNYSIPSDNPFVSTTGVRGEIYAVGLRNPFRWCFDSDTGMMIIADVGQSAFEEIDAIPAGAGGRNLGWPIREGLHDSGNGGTPFSLPLRDPFLEYGRSVGQSIIGGTAYDGVGGRRYAFADYLSNHLWSIPIRRSGGEFAATEISQATDLTVEGGWNGIVAIDEAANGDLIVTELNAGRISRVKGG